VKNHCFFLLSEKTNDIQAKNNALSLLPINVFRNFKRLSSVFQSKQKNRKPEPAVREHFRKFPFYLFFKII